MADLPPGIKDVLMAIQRRRSQAGPPLSDAEVRQLRARLAQQQAASGPAVTRRMAMTGGAAIVGGMAGQGGINPPPMNAPGAASPAYGTQPGVTGGVILAKYVIVFGTGDGVFVYSGTPKLGNPPIAWMGSGLVDPYGNVLPTTTGVAGSGTFSAGNVITTTSGTVGYTATPAANNMLYSDAPAAFTDSSGNAVLAGVTTYGKSGLTYYALNQLPGIDHSGTFGAITTVYTASSQAGPWTAGSQLNLAGSNIAGLLADTLEVFGISGAPTLRLSHGTNLSAAAAFLTANAGGVLNVQDNAGWSGQVPIVQTDTTTNTNANGAGATRLSAIYTIPANDLAAGTTYVMEMPFTATMEGNTLELGLSIDGSSSFTVNNTISGTIVGAGSSINGVIRVGLICTTTGSSGAITAWADGSVNQTSAATTFANSGGLVGNIATGVTLDTTASHTIRVNSLWGASNASQTTSGRTSSCTRTGP